MREGGAAAEQEDQEEEDGGDQKTEAKVAGREGEVDAEEKKGKQGNKDVVEAAPGDSLGEHDDEAEDEGDQEGLGAAGVGQKQEGNVRREERDGEEGQRT